MLNLGEVKTPIFAEEGRIKVMILTCARDLRSLYLLG